VATGPDFLEDYEVLVVETPENLELRLPLAGFGPRFLAQIVDQLLLGLVAVAFVIIAISIMFGYGSVEEAESKMMMIMAVILVGVLCCMVGYYLYFEYAWNGQTPGKRLLGIRVIRCGGLPLTFREVLLRNILRLVDTLPSNGFTGLVCFFATRNQQRLGDLVADTVVVREFKGREPYSWEATVGAAAPGARAMLTPRQSYLIQSYLSRRWELGMDAKLELSERIITNLGHDARSLGLEERDNYLATLLQMQLATLR
jgi:uncharacterized RDD family membrane protein YckC